MEFWTRFVATHFSGSTQANPVSAFDPSGFILVIAVLLLLIGAVIGSLQWLFFSKDGRELRDQMEKNLQGVQEYVDDQVEEHLEFVRTQAVRQGFVAEMLSFAYLSRLAFAITAMLITSYLNALAAVVAGYVALSLSRP